MASGVKEVKSDLGFPKLWEQISSGVTNSFLNLFKGSTIGGYPEEYNPHVHGPYDPGRYYGEKGEPFGEVEIGGLMNWLGKRKKGPKPIARAISRAWWRWQHKYMQPKRVGASGYFQLTVAFIIFFYTINYGKMKAHRNAKYH